MTTVEITAELHKRLDPRPRRVDGRYPGFLNHVPQVVCADGFRMSVQASEHHYCEPRNSTGPWYTVEVGFPSERVEAFMEHCDGGHDATDPTANVYGYVPVEKVAQAILDHGGFAP